MARPANNKAMANPFPVRMEAEVYLKLKIMAENESRSMNKQIELLIKKGVKEYEEEHGVIEVNPDDLYE